MGWDARGGRIMGSMETVTSTDGTPIAYERSGEGPPLVLVHGTTSDHSTWELVLPELQKHFTVYAMDRRGRGESGSGDGRAYDIEREFEDVVALIDSIDRTVALLGHSYGAICALEAALRSGRVRGLVLYEGTFPVPEGTELYPPEALDSVRSSLKADDREGALTIFYHHIALISPEEIEMLRSLPIWAARVALAPTIPREMRAFESYVSNFDPARLANLRTPTLLLLGGDSPPLERAAAEALDAALPDSRIAVMPHQAHLAHRMAPELFVREVVQFLMQALRQGASGVSRGGGTEEDASQTETTYRCALPTVTA
jgi:pimeloyl-ACP methyl ester carboxylesterase